MIDVRTKGDEAEIFYWLNPVLNERVREDAHACDVG